MKYFPVVAGGTWEHRLLDCAFHGESVVFFTSYREDRDPRPRDPWFCVQCSIEVIPKIKGLF